MVMQSSLHAARSTAVKRRRVKGTRARSRRWNDVNSWRPLRLAVACGSWRHQQCCPRSSRSRMRSSHRRGPWLQRTPGMAARDRCLHHLGRRQWPAERRGDLRRRGRRSRRDHPRCRADPRRRLRVTGAVAARDAVQHVRAAVRRPAAGHHRPEDRAGAPVRRARPGLAVMAMAFGRTGTLYAVGDCNPAPKTFERTPDRPPTTRCTGSTCGPGSSPGSARPEHPVLHGPGGRPAGDHAGGDDHAQPSLTPAVLYRIDPATGTATKLVNLVGSNTVMGLASAGTGSSTRPISSRTRACTGSTPRPVLRPRSPPCPSAFPAASN